MTTSDKSPSTSEAEDTTPAPKRLPVWSLPRRVAFRFVFTYFVLGLFPAPITSVLPFGSDAIHTFVSESIWLRISRVVARTILHLPQELTIEPSGSSDTIFDYVQTFSAICLAVVITCIWSVVQRQRQEHQALEAGFRIWLRYTLAVFMLMYGAVKVVKLQFPTPGPMQLIKTYGDSSPMNLLWTFMGYSTPYTFFAGLMEVVPAFLLFFRRTTLLGSLIIMGVMSNVVMLNFCYDVPVKLFSLHMLAMPVLLALPDFPRLMRFFVKNAVAEPASERKPFETKWMERLRLVAKPVFILAAVGMQVDAVWTRVRDERAIAQNVPLVGAHEVDSFVRDGVEVAPLLSDATRLRYFNFRAFDENRFIEFAMMNGKRKYFYGKVDPEKKTLTLDAPKTGEEEPPSYTFHYTERDAGIWEFEGTFEGAAILVKLHKIDPSKYLLMNRGFHWVNEDAFNR